jgi:hypothetical protein
MRIAKWGMAALLAMSAGVAAAYDQSTQTTTPQQTDQKKTQKQDDQQDSLAAASRRAREQKPPQKPAKVWTNDNLPTTPNSINVVGEGNEPATQANAETTQTETKPEQPKAAGGSGTQLKEERKAELEKQLADAKEQLKSLMTDFDILSRKHQLDQQTYYGKPDYTSDTQGAAALQEEDQVIAAKQQQVNVQQKKVDDLATELKELEDKQ